MSTPRMKGLPCRPAPIERNILALTGTGEVRNIGLRPYPAQPPACKPAVVDMSKAPKQPLMKRAVVQRPQVLVVSAADTSGFPGISSQTPPVLASEYGRSFLPPVRSALPAIACHPLVIACHPLVAKTCTSPVLSDALVWQAEQQSIRGKQTSVGMSSESWSRSDGCIYKSSPMVCRDNYYDAIS